MVSYRSSFGLTSVGDLLFATGGFGDARAPLESVEAFSAGVGWRQEPGMGIGVAKYSHCSVAIGSWLYTIGGLLDGTTEDNVSNVVEAYDTSLISSEDDPLTTWIGKANLIDKRHSHGCHVGAFEGKEGIFVAGGFNGTDYLSSVEFYIVALDSWHAIGSLNTARRYCPMTILGEQIMLGGGYPGPMASLEAWNGTSWVELTMKLSVGRARYAAVSIKAGKLLCRTE